MDMVLIGVMTGTFVVLIIAAFLVWKKFLREEIMDTPCVGASNLPIPEGYNIFAHDLWVSEGQHSNALALATCEHPRLGFVLDPKNATSPHAIQVMGYGDGRTYFLGYLPHDICQALYATQMQTKALARLILLQVSKKGDVQIKYQVLGPIEHKKEFLDALFVANARVPA